MRKLWILTGFFLLLDQFSKYLISNIFELNSGYEIIPTFFSLFYVHNYGAAFSLFQDSRFFLIGITIFALGFIYWSFIYQKDLVNPEKLAYAFLFAGILGNLIDRIIHGYVIDFLAFSFFNYNFPIFNLADSFIVCSVFYLLIFEWRKKNEHSI